MVPRMDERYMDGRREERRSVYKFIMAMFAFGAVFGGSWDYLVNDNLRTLQTSLGLMAFATLCFLFAEIRDLLQRRRFRK